MKRFVLVLLLVAGAAGAWYLTNLRAMTDVGAGFVAKQMCSCMFIGQRSFASCRPDMLESMDPIEAEVLPGGDGVRAWVPLLAERIARHEAPFGCTLEP